MQRSTTVSGAVRWKQLRRSNNRKEHTPRTIDTNSTGHTTWLDQAAVWAFERRSRREFSNRDNESESIRPSLASPNRSLPYLNLLHCCLRDLLAIEYIQTLKVLQCEEMLDRGIGDRRAIIELENTECFLGVHARAKVTNAFVTDLFASRQSLVNERIVSPCQRLRCQRTRI